MEGPLLTLNALFARSVCERGDSIAVRDARQACSYRGLATRADALARELAARGARPGDRIVIYADRTVEAVAAILAVLQTGAVFVPVSVDSPPARVALLLEDAEPRLLLTDRAGHLRLAGLEHPVPRLDIEAFPPEGPAGDRPAAEVVPEDLAYIIYTSGTTGRPKGVMIEHGAIARRFHDWAEAFSLRSAPCRVLQLAKLGFDVFVGDLVKALGAGGTLVICPGDSVLVPAELHRWLIDESIDYVEVVPAVLRILVEHLEESGQDLAGLKILNCGADLWTPEEYTKSRRITRVSRLFNSYGVTECTVESTLFEDDGGALETWETLPIGRPLASDAVLVVDEALEPVGPGVAGQICLGGPCVARGYLNRPELNETAFLRRTDRDGESVRYYKTGDLGRIGADGVLEFLGRIDFQLKIDGHRVEPEEIERVIERFPAIEQAVVCFDRERHALVAYVRRTAGASFQPAEHAAYLERHLPSFMVPRRIVEVGDFPLTQNGKIDRARLAAESGREPTGPPRSRPHDLHRSAGVEDLKERLWQRDVDLLSVVHELVKPSAKLGVLLGGSLADGTATETSPVELLVLLPDDRALKRRKREVQERPAMCASLQIEGIRIDLDFLANPDIDLDAPEPCALSGGSSPDARLLSWLANGWVVHGEDVVDRWRHYYHLTGKQ